MQGVDRSGVEFGSLQRGRRAALRGTRLARICAPPPNRPDPSATPMNNAPAAVEIRGADKVYASGVRALEPIDLTVREGETVTLVGPSGCGKSTLLRLVAGLIEPGRGSVRVADAFAGRTAFVFQQPTLMPWASVEANVRLPLDLAKRERKEARHAVAHALELVGLSQFADAHPRELSGGMQMRASIARALVTQPRLLLMDEPFGALDEITRNRLDRDVAALAAQEKLTMLFVTHSIYEAAFLSSRVLVMSARPGRLYREVAIDAPQPRDHGFRRSEVFSRACGELSQLLSEAAGEALT
jgi:NitT/TauT family transport system ATP-binding protein